MPHRTIGRRVDRITAHAGHVAATRHERDVHQAVLPALSRWAGVSTEELLLEGRRLGNLFRLLGASTPDQCIAAAAGDSGLNLNVLLAGVTEARLVAQVALANLSS